MNRSNIEKAIEALTTSDIDTKKVEILNYVNNLNESIERINSECEFLWDEIASLATLVCEKR